MNYSTSSRPRMPPASGSSRISGRRAQSARAAAYPTEQARPRMASPCLTGAEPADGTSAFGWEPLWKSRKLPLRKWAIAIYLETTNLKGVSSMKIHRDIRVSQKTAWFMLHRIREAWKQELGDRFEGPVEIDETFIGGKARNMHTHKRKQVIKGRGPVGKTAVIGAKDRATNRVTAAVIKSTDQLTLQGFVAETVEPGAKVYTDDHGGYIGLPNHETVRHSVKEYVNGMAHNERH